MRVKYLVAVVLFIIITGNVFSRSADDNVMHITKKEFKTKVFDYEKNSDNWKYLGDKPAFIDFYASWCGPCKAMDPIIKKVAEEYADRIYVYKVDIDTQKDLASDFGIQVIPSLLFVPIDGQPVMIKGAMSKKELIDTIDQYLLE